MNIYLIGMMASGKSFVGNLLALKLNYNFCDTDKLIENKYHKSIAEIINLNGVEFFRCVEHEMLKVLSSCVDTVIATGGGIVLLSDNVALMKENGLLVYLNVGLDTLKKRLSPEEIIKRPLLKEYSLENLFAERKRIYEDICDISLCCEGLSLVDTCSQLAAMIKKHIENGSFVGNRFLPYIY